jgi:hypothetical protein
MDLATMILVQAEVGSREQQTDRRTQGRSSIDHRPRQLDLNIAMHRSREKAILSALVLAPASRKIFFKLGPRLSTETHLPSTEI